MKIAFVGTQCNGKTTLIEKFLNNWPMYKRPEKTYRDIISEKKVKLNQKGDEKSQRIILDALIDETQLAIASGEENIVFDRCVLDNIVYSIWLNAKEKVSDDFITTTKFLVQETLKSFDVIFYLPLRPEFKLEKRKGRDMDPVYREEIDNIFGALVKAYEKGSAVFFPREDCPAIISLEGPPDLRLELVKLYIQPNGRHYGEDTPSLIYTE
jgi:thymidylate kinase